MTTLIVLARFVGSGDLIILKVVGHTYSSAIAKFVNTTSRLLLKPGTGRFRLLNHRTMRTRGTKQKLCDFCTLLQTPSLLLVSVVKLLSCKSRNITLELDSLGRGRDYYIKKNIDMVTKTVLNCCLRNSKVARHDRVSSGSVFCHCNALYRQCLTA